MLLYASLLAFFVLSDSATDQQSEKKMLNQEKKLREEGLSFADGAQHLQVFINCLREESKFAVNKTAAKSILDYFEKQITENAGGKTLDKKDLDCKRANTLAKKAIKEQLQHANAKKDLKELGRLQEKFVKEIKEAFGDRSAKATEVIGYYEAILQEYKTGKVAE